MAPTSACVGIFTAALASTTMLAPTPTPSANLASLSTRVAGSAHFVRFWDECNLIRYQYDFEGTTCNDFEIGIILAGGIPGPEGMNFQCGWTGTRDGFLQFEVTVAEGAAGAAVVSNGIGYVTGQSCGDSGFCPNYGEVMV